MQKGHARTLATIVATVALHANEKLVIDLFSALILGRVGRWTCIYIVTLHCERVMGPCMRIIMDATCKSCTHERLCIMLGGRDRQIETHRSRSLGGNASSCKLPLAGLHLLFCCSLSLSLSLSLSPGLSLYEGPSLSLEPS